MRVSPRWFLLLCVAHLVAIPTPAQTNAVTEPPPIVKVYLHGRIYTNDPQHPWAAAIATRNDKISCVGSISQILLECGGGDENVETIQLNNRFVMPGFNDAHTHVGHAGLDLITVQLNGAPSVAELQKRLAEAVAHHKEGEWITGAGWDHTLWPDRKFPTRQDLDAFSPKNPVYLTHVSGHVAVANSLALRAANIDRTTDNPSGGAIEHDATGEPTGMLEEGSAMRMVAQQIPEITMEQRQQGIELALADATKNGVTSIQDNSDAEDFQVYRELKEKGRLTVRITEWMPFLAPLGDLENMRSEAGTSDPWLRSGLLKAIVDGALGTRTAAMLAPYSDDATTSGILIIPIEKLKAMAIERDKAGFQLGFHAIGDKTNRVALDVFEAVAKANGPRDRRDRVEHAQIVAAEDIPRFGQLRVVASMQPSHQTSDMRWAESRVGPQRIKGAYAWASLQKSSAQLAFGTDYPVEPINPMRGLYACTTRELPEGGPQGGWQPQEKLPLADCIAAYTSGSAYAEFMDGKKGQLRTGQYADFIVLSDDLTKLPPADFLKTKVLRTVVGGRTVYQAP